MALIERGVKSNSAFDGGLDQYYTPDETAAWAVKETLAVIGGWSGPVVEPSAGTGAFIRAFDQPVLSFDIDPRHEQTEKADWLSVAPSRFAGALVIGNPPYGHFGNGALRFINHAAKSAEFVSFILPPLFDRVTMKRRISLDFHLRLSTPVPDNSYYGPNGEKYTHKRTLQVWGRGERRVLEELPDGSPWVKHLPGPEGADVFVIRNGGRAGQVLVGGSHSIKFAWPMTLLRPDSLQKLKEIEPKMVAIALLGTSIPNMPKVEINNLLKECF